MFSYLIAVIRCKKQTRTWRFTKENSVENEQQCSLPLGVYKERVLDNLSLTHLESNWFSLVASGYSFDVLLSLSISFIHKLNVIRL